MVRAALLSSRYPYSVGMDGNVLTGGDLRCLPTNVSTVGNQMKRNGVATALIGKYDIGYSSWACLAVGETVILLAPPSHPH